MPLVQAKCTNCGGSLTVDNTKKAAVCPFCGEAYIVEEAVNNYQVEHLHADVVNIVDDSSSEARLKAGEGYLKLRNYIDADKAFEEACKMRPQDYRGWWGRVRALTINLTGIRESKLASVNLCYNSAWQMSSGEDRQTIEAKFSQFFEAVVQPKLKEAKTAYEDAANTAAPIRAEISKLENDQKETESIRDKLYKKVEICSKIRKHRFLAFILLAAVVYFIVNSLSFRRVGAGVSPVSLSVSIMILISAVYAISVKVIDLKWKSSNHRLNEITIEIRKRRTALNPIEKETIEKQNLVYSLEKLRHSSINTEETKTLPSTETCPCCGTKVDVDDPKMGLVRCPVCDTTIYIKRKN